MKAMLIYNPAAGQRDAEGELHRAVEYLEGLGWLIHWRQTRGSGDATTYAREAVDMGVDVVIVAGGDGSIGQVANGLAGTRIRLGVLPTGTSNVWAKEARIPIWNPLRQNSVQEAAKILAEGHARCVDLGRVNGRYFLMWVGIGFDAQVTADVESQPERKRRLGKLAFLIALIVQTLNLTGTKSTLLVDGKKLSSRIFLAVASNIHLYGDIIRIAPMASMTDGRLDVCIFKAYSGIEALRLMFSLLLGWHTRDPEVKMLQARRLVVETDHPLPVHADGEIVGNTPVEITVVPNALHVIIPRELVQRRPRWQQSVFLREAPAPAEDILNQLWQRFK
jgi:diacylglycerol kinase (ATP)